MDIDQLQPINIRGIGSVDPGRLRSDDERRTTILGRGKLRADTRARSVRDEVMVNNEEGLEIGGEIGSILEGAKSQKQCEIVGREGRRQTFPSAKRRSWIVANHWVPYKQEMSYSLATAPADLQISN